ncbi:hypothetical protein [Crateriforma conspicua]|nr:hypothetical protein [Crateriforma conspicua]
MALPHRIDPINRYQATTAGTLMPVTTNSLNFYRDGFLTGHVL